ncbi:hypothetical protein [Actinomyces naeslundii]|uniref:hypothetical protein n=1 Tax=Actinomyces naeslundii TaxID=1655 RepID=UPI0028EB941E|nr:hypothetical protein [Actinomyces naeslundii]
MGLLALLVFVPGFNVLLAAAMMVVGPWNKKDLREPARTNRRRAASWGLTLLLVELALVVIQIVVASIVGRSGFGVFYPVGRPDRGSAGDDRSACWRALFKGPGLPRQGPPLRRHPLLPLTIRVDGGAARAFRGRRGGVLRGWCWH